MVDICLSIKWDEVNIGQHFVVKELSYYGKGSHMFVNPPSFKSNMILSDSI